MSFLDLAPDHRLFYQSFEGREDRPWLIFLHEGLGSVAQWKNFPERICRRTDCPALLYDRPGHGRSPCRRRPRHHRFHRTGTSSILSATARRAGHPLPRALMPPFPPSSATAPLFGTA
jgi:pimeloyl-ACP methyl ester carboxylesterase